MIASSFSGFVTILPVDFNTRFCENKSFDTATETFELAESRMREQKTFSSDVGLFGCHCRGACTRSFSDFVVELQLTIFFIRENKLNVMHAL